jgi:CheY-like chemotaxis protein
MAMHFALSRPGSRAATRGQTDVVDFVSSNAVDLILLDIDSSLLAGLALAAHIRAAGRARNARACAVLVAATSSECKLLDCLVGGSAIKDVLQMPCDGLHFADRVDLWCPAADRLISACR